MKDLKKINSIFNELSSEFKDLKAEVLISEIQETTNFPDALLLIKNESSFSRSYRRDVINVKNNRDKDWIELKLSRDGLYDSLPEGLFHSTNLGKKKNYATVRKIYKQEEKDARLFFTPLENEFFYQKKEIEKNERKLLYELSNLKDDFLIDFWNIEKNIPKEYALRLIKLLPYSHKISGDFELTRLSLEQILGVKVAFKKKLKNNLINKDKTSNKRANKLGVDMVLNSNEKQVFHPYLEAKIGPINGSDIDNYLTKEGVLVFIKKFFDYFLPFEIEVVTKLIVENKEGFELNNTNQPVMGISTKL